MTKGSRRAITTTAIPASTGRRSTLFAALAGLLALPAASAIP